MDNKEYSWKWVTSDLLLNEGPCEFCFASLTADGGNADATIYNGINTGGEVLKVLKTLQNVSQQVHPYKPLHCENGLYVDIGSNVKGVLIQWRELPS